MSICGKHLKMMKVSRPQKLETVAAMYEKQSRCLMSSNSKRQGTLRPEARGCE
jgi:hypothetical protein